MMKKSQKILAIIPARKGSKRLPGKNTKLLYGKKMIEYSIDEALKSKYIDNIVITTDDNEIIGIVNDKKKKFSNLLTLIKRPKELSGDDVPTIPVMQHVLNSIPKEYSTVVLLQPTSPLRTVEHIDKCIDIFIKEGCSSLVTVKEVEPFNIFVPNGAVFITERKMIIKDNKLRDNNVRLVAMSQEESIDIDTEIDFKAAEEILKWKSTVKK